MNLSMIRYILGNVLCIESVLLLICVGIGAIYGESEALCYLMVAVLAAVLGLLMRWRKPKNAVFYLKDGCVATALSWILMSIVGALPFLLTGELTNFFDALFETVSGFTTTGSSVFSDVESLSHITLFWRSFTHWIGGMGVLVFLLAVVPLAGGSQMHLMRAESPGPSVGKLVPRIRHTARILYLIYLGMTVVMFFVLLVCGMTPFESINTTFSTAGTGGYGFRNDSMASFSPLILWVVGIFMLLFGVNFNFYYYLLLKAFKDAFSMEEVRWYIAIIVGFTGMIAINVGSLFASGFTSLTQAFFQVSSIITTTGFSSANFDLWPTTSKLLLIIVTIVGACAGSTGGGLKVSRLVIGSKALFKEFALYVHPKSVKKVKMDGKPIEHEVIRSTNVYFFTYFVLFTLLVFLISFEGMDLVSTFTAVAATFNNVGPGLGAVGPLANFGGLTNGSKLVLSFGMLAGRLELFPMLMLFHPALWKESFRSKK